MPERLRAIKCGVNEPISRTQQTLKHLRLTVCEKWKENGYAFRKYIFLAIWQTEVNKLHGISH